jgi:hypothetical protein
MNERWEEHVRLYSKQANKVDDITQKMCPIMLHYFPSPESYDANANYIKEIITSALPEEKQNIIQNSKLIHGRVAMNEEEEMLKKQRGIVVKLIKKILKNIRADVYEEYFKDRRESFKNRIKQEEKNNDSDCDLSLTTLTLQEIEENEEEKEEENEKEIEEEKEETNEEEEKEETNEEEEREKDEVKNAPV